MSETNENYVENNSYESSETAQETNTGGVAEPTDADSSAQPTQYDRQQDEETSRKLSEKDAEIQRLTEALAAVQSTVAPPDAVVSNQVPGLESPATATNTDPTSGEAQFHEVHPPASNESSTTDETPGNVSPDAVASAVVDELSARGSEQETVNVAPAPELSDPETLHAETIRNQEELKEAVGEILTLVREIHETVAYVKAEAPKIGAALAASPFGKMLPSFVNGL